MGFFTRSKQRIAKESCSTARVICRTRYAKTGATITTMVLRYHRFIHGELMTHRVFSRSAMSSRAVPIWKILAQVWNDPAMPVEWGAATKGMQAHTQLKGIRLRLARVLWRAASKVACVFAYFMMKAGLAKQVTNRVLEPWQWMQTVVTSTEWDNFFELRDHPDAQPEFRDLARKMKTAMVDAEFTTYTVTETPDPQNPYHWHLPFVNNLEARVIDYVVASSASSARTSFNNHEGKLATRPENWGLFNRLVSSKPLHASPTEHQAFPAEDADIWSANFRGWHQYRQSLEAHGIDGSIEGIQLQ